MKRRLTATLLCIAFMSAIAALCCCASDALTDGQDDRHGAMMAYTVVRLCAPGATETMASTGICVLPRTVWQVPGAQISAQCVCLPQTIAAHRDERARMLTLLCRRFADPDPDGV